MKVQVLTGLALAGLVLLAAAPAGAQEDKLVGMWNAVGQPGKTAEFRADGVFRYVYRPGPPITVLQIRWKLGWFGKLTFSMEDGGSARSCSYKIDGETLTVDDGSGRSCIDHSPVNMVTRFTRAK